MFPLHETTQRKLCRTAFIAVCLAPTVLLAGYGLRLHAPGHRAQIESQLANELGVRLLVDSVAHPRPGETRLFHVRLRDPETGQEIGQIPELEIMESDGKTLVHAAQPSIYADQFALIWRRLEDRVLRAEPTTNRIELSAADLTIQSPGSEAQTLRHVTLHIERNAEQTSAALRYSVAGVAMAEPAVLRIVRRREGAVKITQQLSWHTGAAALPVAPWTPRFPWLAQLGKHCTFRGELTAEDTPLGWRGEVGGELAHIDLDQLVSNQFPHKLSGDARAIVESLRFEQGRIAAARGRFEAGTGVAGQSLLDSAVEQLSLRHDGEAATSAEQQPLQRYAKLALHFTLDDNRLQLRGECADSPPETALMVGNERYQTTPDVSLSPLSLVRTLSPTSDHQVPATEATRSLVQVLPLPKEASQAETVPPRGHVRGESE